MRFEGILGTCLILLSPIASPPLTTTQIILFKFLLTPIQQFRRPLFLRPTAVGTRQQQRHRRCKHCSCCCRQSFRDRVDLTIKNTGVSATNLSATGTSYNVPSGVTTLADGTKDARLRPLKAGSNKVSLAFVDSNNAIAVDVGFNISIGDLSQSGPLALAVGGTAATTATQARANLGAAKLGANSDITSLTGLTAALSIAQGGTAAGTVRRFTEPWRPKYITNVGSAGKALSSMTLNWLAMSIRRTERH